MAAATGRRSVDLGDDGGDGTGGEPGVLEGNTVYMTDHFRLDKEAWLDINITSITI